MKIKNEKKKVFERKKEKYFRELRKKKRLKI
jgi:hypothetical protein